MLPNEVFALACLHRYAESGDIVDASNGQFAHCPQPKRYGDKGYYLTWEDHQHQGLLQSRDIGECCFFSGDTKKWLLECDPFPEDYFELWEIHDEFSSLNMIHEEKDELGRSVHGVKSAERLHKEKDDRGRSLCALNMNLKLHAEKNEKGKSKRASEGAQKTNAQRWKCLESGHVANPGNLAKWQRAHNIDTSLRVRIL